MSVAVNLSVRQVLDPDILELIEGVLSRSRIRPESLILELTESIFMHDTDYLGRMLASLGQRGSADLGLVKIGDPRADKHSECRAEFLPDWAGLI